MILKLWNFQKAPNSTKRPPDPPGVILENVELIADTSLLRPVIKVQMQNPSNYNYAYLSEFDRYYFIEDINSSMGFWNIALVVDPLASWKVSIGNSSQYVVRSSARKSDRLPDARFPASYKPVFNRKLIFPNGYPFAGTVAGGCYIVGINNKNQYGGFGSASYYIMDPIQMGTLKHLLFNSADYMYNDNLDMTEGTAKVLFDPMEYITSVMWFPFSRNTTGLPSTVIEQGGLHFGWWTLPTPVSLAQVDKWYRFDGLFTFKLSYSWDIPKHPLSDAIGNWLNTGNYSTIRVHWPLLGDFDLDPILFAGNKCKVNMVIDLITGGLTAEIVAVGAGNVQTSARTINTTIGVPCSISSQNINSVRGLSSVYHTEQTFGVASAVTGIASSSVQLAAGIGAAMAGTAGSEKLIASGASGMSNSIIGGAQKIYNNYLDYATERTPHPQTIGNNGSVSAVLIEPYMEYVYKSITNTNTELLGSPLCDTVKLSDIPGFIQCDQPKLQISATKTEIEAVYDYLKGGFFYE